MAFRSHPKPYFMCGVIFQDLEDYIFVFPYNIRRRNSREHHVRWSVPFMPREGSPFTRSLEILNQTFAKNTVINHAVTRDTAFSV